MYKITEPIQIIKNKIKQLNVNQLINRKLSNGAAGAAMRRIDETDPMTWEFSGFSQNGEDGIIDFLIQNLKERNKYFIEVGAADGIENNSAWLAMCRKYSGLMIDGNTNLLSTAKKIVHNLGVEYLDWFVTKENIGELRNYALYDNPDYFSLDIDGNDYHLVKLIIEGGFIPKIITVEYNSAYGPNNCLTIPYQPDFVIDMSSLESYVYYGVSISGWKKYFESIGYKFITVDSNGVNAFFVDPSAFDSEFLDNIKGVHFNENFYQMKKYRKPWSFQFSHMSEKPFFEIK